MDSIVVDGLLVLIFRPRSRPSQLQSKCVGCSTLFEFESSAVEGVISESMSQSANYLVRYAISPVCPINNAQRRKISFRSYGFRKSHLIMMTSSSRSLKCSSPVIIFALCALAVASTIESANPHLFAILFRSSFSAPAFRASATSKLTS